MPFSISYSTTSSSAEAWNLMVAPVLLHKSNSKSLIVFLYFISIPAYSSRKSKIILSSRKRGLRIFAESIAMRFNHELGMLPTLSVGSFGSQERQLDETYTKSKTIRISHTKLALVILPEIGLPLIMLSSNIVQSLSFNKKCRVSKYSSAVSVR